MLKGDDNTLTIEMTEQDYGETLPITLQVNDVSFGEEDHFSFKIFKGINEKPIIEKEYSNIKNNTIEFSLTQEESALLPKGRYYYDIDWFQINNFLSNLIAKKKIKVLDKAGGVHESNV